MARIHPNMVILSWFSLLIITSNCYATTTSTSTSSTAMVMIGPFGQQHHHSCLHVRYPDLCVQTLAATTTLLHPSKNISTVDVISALLNITISESKLPVSNFEALSSHFISSEAQSARFSLGTYTFIYIYIYD